MLCIVKVDTYEYVQVLTIFVKITLSKGWNFYSLLEHLPGM